MKDVVTFYKIRDKNTGLFSEGGCSPRFSKNGKTWPTRGALKSHLTLLGKSFTCCLDGKNHQFHSEIPESWEIVEYILNLTDANVISAKEEQMRPAKK